MLLCKSTKLIRAFKRHIGLCVRNCKNDEHIMQVFDRKTKILQRNRAALAPDVDVYDYLKAEIGFRLADRVFDVKRTFNSVADIGCSRGYVAKHLLPDNVKELIICDVSAQNLDNVKIHPGIQVKRQVLDEENIKFEPNSLDLVISNLALHWVNDLPNAFKQILHGLKEDGVFIASVFGGETLYELRGSLQLAELERRGGLSPHISPFAEVRDIGSLLTRAGFSMLTIDTDEIIVNYPSIFELMWDLKGMAENNAAINRSLHLNREVQFAAGAIYEEFYGNPGPDNGKVVIPATFQIINMLGWKPHPKQPKPLQRGTGEVSLKDLYKLDEVIRDVKKVKTDDNQSN